MMTASSVGATCAAYFSISARPPWARASEITSRYQVAPGGNASLPCCSTITHGGSTARGRLCSLANVSTTSALTLLKVSSCTTKSGR